MRRPHPNVNHHIPNSHKVGNFPLWKLIVAGSATMGATLTPEAAS
jgi:hypothetical protein